MAGTVEYSSVLRGRLKKAGRAYIQLKNHQRNSELKSDDALHAEMDIFFAANESLFKDVIEHYYIPNSKWELGSFDMFNGIMALNAYLTEKANDNQGIPLIGTGYTGNAPAQQSGSLSQEDTKIEESRQGMLDKLVEKTDKSGAAEGQDAEEGGLSAAQRKGLQDISAWFFRNVDKVGLKLGKYSAGESAYEFVNDFILKQPARLKLMAYYLVEKKKRHKPDVLDLAESQMDYVPNLEQFKNQMIATKWKFWKRVDGSHIYWEKLGEAMRFAINAKEMIDGLPGAGDMEAINRGEELPDTSGSNAQLTNPSGQSSSAAGKREACRRELIQYALDYRKISENNKLSKKDKEKALQDKAEEIKNTYTTMREADKLVVSEELLDEGVGGDSTKLQTAAEYVDIGETASGLPGTIVDKIGSNIAHLGDAAEDGSKGPAAKMVENLGWNLEKYDLPVFQKINMVTSTVGGVVAFVSGVLSFIDMAKHFKSATGGEIFQNVMDTVSKAGSVSETIAGAALTGQIWARGGEMTAEAVGNALEGPMAVTSIVTGSVGMAVAGARIGVEGSRYLDTRSISKRLKSKDNNPIANEEDRDTASNINALQARIASAHAKTAAYDMASGVLQTVGGILDLCGVTSIVGFLVSTAGTLVNIAKSIHEYFLKKSNLEATIDTYLGVDKVEAEIIGTLASELKKREKFYNQMKDSPVKSVKMQELEPQRKELAALRNLMGSKTLRDEIRIRGAAMAGYPSKKSFYEKIVGDYATFLHKKIFYNDAGEVITKTMRKDDAQGYGTAERELYERMLTNSGLKARYPDTDRDKPKPSIQNIARKLHI